MAGEDSCQTLCAEDCVRGGSAAMRLDLGQGLWHGLRELQLQILQALEKFGNIPNGSLPQRLVSSSPLS